VTEPPYDNVYPNGSGIHWFWKRAGKIGFFLAAEVIAVIREADCSFVVVRIREK
jgi:hypothetical protein